MSHGGGRGGGRGGRRGGGGGGGMMRNLPWDYDPNLELDGRPSELFPAYNVPQAAPLSKKEEKQTSYFILFREQVHDGPLYTQARTWNLDPGEPARVYGQDQINKRYGVRSKASVDPFLSMPTYSQRFNKQERSLPDLGSRPFAKEYFPSELHDTLDGLDEPAGKRRKTNKNKALVLSNITSLRTAEEVFLSDAAQQSSVTNAGDPNKALQVLERIDNNEDGGVADELFLEDDDEWVRTANEDGEDVGEDEDQYEDESDDDYNAEQYFSENQVDDDFDDGGDGGGDDYF